MDSRISQTLGASPAQPGELHVFVDESALFRKIGRMRSIVTTAQKATRKARCDADRRQQLQPSALPSKPVLPKADTTDSQTENQTPAQPFDQIEEW